MITRKIHFGTGSLLAGYSKTIAVPYSVATLIQLSEHAELLLHIRY